MSANTKQSMILDKSGQPFQHTLQDIADARDNSYARMESISITQALTSNDEPIRSRFDIHHAYTYMGSDPIINAALNLHVTNALGAHETDSNVFFLEKKPNISPKDEAEIDYIQKTVVPILNAVAYQVAFLAAQYGDSYARIYTKDKKGVVRVDVDDLLLPPLVQPVTVAGLTVGAIVASEQKDNIILTGKQFARCKLPRMGVVPQQRMIYNSWLTNLQEDDIDAHQPLPDTIGGSFLQEAERPFWALQKALIGMSSSRIADAVRESILMMNMDGMTEPQQVEFYSKVTQLLKKSKAKIETAIKQNSPITEKVIHVVPVLNEKQLTSVDNQALSGGASGANGYNVDDVMFYAKQLAAVLGLDLSMLGFSDILSGGLGEGGFFRVAAQAAQRAIKIRQGFTGFVDHVIDIHCNAKLGGVFPSDNRPYTVTYIGAQTALEKEKQEIRERQQIGASSALQAMQQMKELGFDEQASNLMLKKVMMFDEEDAIIYAKVLAQASADSEEQPNTEEE